MFIPRTDRLNDSVDAIRGWNKCLERSRWIPAWPFQRNTPDKKCRPGSGSIPWARILALLDSTRHGFAAIAATIQVDNTLENLDSWLQVLV